MKASIIKQNFGSIIFFAFLLFSFLQMSNFFFEILPKEVVIYSIIFFVFSGFASIYLNNANRLGLSVNRYLVLEVLLISFLFLSVILQYIFLENRIDDIGRSALHATFSYFSFGLIYFYIGSAIQGSNVGVIKRRVYILPIFYLLISILSNLDGGLVLSYVSLSANRSDDVNLDHLVIGQAAVVLILFSMVFSPNKYKYILYGISLLCLFMLGGRAALFAFLFAILIKELMQGGLINLLWTLVGLLFVVGLVYFYTEVDASDPLFERMIFSDGLNRDDSKIARDVFMAEALNGLLDQALFGNPNVLIDKYGSLGTYSHNILSAWQFFGLIPFFLLLIIIVVVARYVYINRYILNNPVDEFGLLLFLYASISIFMGKGIMFSLFWMGLGFWMYRMRR